MTPPDPDVAKGVRLHAAGRFHAAHGAFERAWVARGRAAPGVQALIQIAAACVRLERGQWRPADRLLRRARSRLVQDPSVGLHVRREAVLEGIDRCLDDLRQRATGTSPVSEPRVAYPPIRPVEA